MIGVLGFGTNWRLAIAAGLAAGAIGLTRLRYAPLVATALLAVTLLLAQTDRAPGSDGRAVPARSSDR